MYCNVKKQDWSVQITCNCRKINVPVNVTVVNDNVVNVVNFFLTFLICV